MSVFENRGQSGGSFGGGGHGQRITGGDGGFGKFVDRKKNLSLFSGFDSVEDEKGQGSGGSSFGGAHLGRA